MFDDRRFDYHSGMRSLVAALLLCLHLAPTVAVGVCASGLAEGSEAVNCPMANPQMAASEQAAAARGVPVGVALLQGEHRTHCCTIDDLCMFSSPAIRSAASTVAVLTVASTAPAFSYTSAVAREATAPPSPPPNA